MMSCKWDYEENTFKVVNEEYLNEKIKLSEEDLKYRMDALQDVMISIRDEMEDLMTYYRKLWKFIRKDETQKKGKPMHKKIMEKASKALKKDASHYAKEAKKAKSPVKKKHEKVERKEALSAAKDLKKRAKMAHEY